MHSIRSLGVNAPLPWLTLAAAFLLISAASFAVAQEEGRGEERGREGSRQTGQEAGASERQEVRSRATVQWKWPSEESRQALAKKLARTLEEYRAAQQAEPRRSGAMVPESDLEIAILPDGTTRARVPGYLFNTIEAHAGPEGQLSTVCKKGAHRDGSPTPANHPGEEER
jgi:hypothetical protein